jgi:hypothetical protein
VNPTEWLVTLGGVAAIVWVQWWFFFAERRSPDEAERRDEQGRT